MITAIVIDDETRARETIIQMISLYCKNISVVDQASDTQSAYVAINQHKPDIIFLDINLKTDTGFDLLKRFNQIDFKIIFITAFDKYAINAFKFSAIDYILKPVHPDDLIAAVAKVERLHQKEVFQKTFNTLLSNFEHKAPEQKVIVLKTSENIHLVNVGDIIRCESDRNYTMFYLSDKKKILVSQTLKEYDELLESFGFYRIHQSHLINIKYVDHYVKSEGGYLVLKDGSQIPVSHRKKDYLLDLFNKMS
jgi:two-component system LytT family response regulator